jgi:hypothetical protein
MRAGEAMEKDGEFRTVELPSTVTVLCDLAQEGQGGFG